VDELSRLGFEWRIDGQTLDCTDGLLHEQAIRETYSLSNIAKYRSEGLIKPVGFAITNGGLSPFYKPEQIQKLKRKLGVTLESTTGLLNELQFKRRFGFTNLAKYRKRGLIKPRGRGMTNSRASFFYHPDQAEDLRKALGITLKSTNGLLNEAQFIKASGLARIGDYRKTGVIKPAGYALTHGAGVTAYYRPEQIRNLKKNLGVTLPSTKGLLTEMQVRERYGLSNITKYRKQGLIKPAGYALTNKTMPHYRPSQISKLKKALGITLDSTTGLLTEKQFGKKFGFTNITRYRAKGLIKPVGYAIRQSGVGPFYHPRQAKELRRNLASRNA
jgi:hypothetical protein